MRPGECYALGLHVRPLVTPVTGVHVLVPGPDQATQQVAQVVLVDDLQLLVLPPGQYLAPGEQLVAVPPQHLVDHGVSQQVFVDVDGEARATGDEVEALLVLRVLGAPLLPLPSVLGGLVDLGGLLLVGLLDQVSQVDGLAAWLTGQHIVQAVGAPPRGVPPHRGGVLQLALVHQVDQGIANRGVRPDVGVEHDDHVGAVHHLQIGGGELVAAPVPAARDAVDRDVRGGVLGGHDGLAGAFDDEGGPGVLDRPQCPQRGGGASREDVLLDVDLAGRLVGDDDLVVGVELGDDDAIGGNPGEDQTGQVLLGRPVRRRTRGQLALVHHLGDAVLAGGLLRDPAVGQVLQSLGRVRERGVEGACLGRRFHGTFVLGVGWCFTERVVFQGATRFAFGPCPWVSWPPGLLGTSGRRPVEVALLLDLFGDPPVQSVDRVADHLPVDPEPRRSRAVSTHGLELARREPQEAARPGLIFKADDRRLHRGHLHLLLLGAAGSCWILPGTTPMVPHQSLLVQSRRQQV